MGIAMRMKAHETEARLSRHTQIALVIGRREGMELGSTFGSSVSTELQRDTCRRAALGVLRDGKQAAPPLRKASKGSVPLLHI